MADIDEDDVSQLPTHNADNVDLSDETQDFRFLTSLSISDNGASKLPKRGEKDFEPHATSLQASALDASRQAMHQAISSTRIHNPKNHVVATYDPVSNMARVDQVKGQAFRTMGKHISGVMWLLPEEALYLLERGSLDIRWPSDDGEDEGLPMSLQGAYAAFIGMEDSANGHLTLEKYTVYAGLKRSGYIVTRADSWDGVKHVNHSADKHPSPSILQNFWSFGVFRSLWSFLLPASRRGPNPGAALGPLVSPGLYRHYNDVYRLLDIVQFHDPRQLPQFSPEESNQDPFRVAYSVYKPTPAWKKSAPGPPDFRVAVVNARDTSVPTLPQLNDLLASTPYDPPKPDAPLYQKLKQGHRNVILAIVDQGIAPSEAASEVVVVAADVAADGSDRSNSPLRNVNGRPRYLRTYPNGEAKDAHLFDGMGDLGPQGSAGDLPYPGAL
ncbi:trna splicing endonuclease subunit [Diplodia corticola]|uniref:Trna splicing endonuclease subunit n=1 Tax=Diplodia corticola TaxID=236234 RepID=A0A1J9RC59_9PEZI|nr:trna splicing endonuclease subunit [Diplodia corticola]OJD37746.1 trna splicing endonuclease subunit [Diplodia corticola]